MAIGPIGRTIAPGSFVTGMPTPDQTDVEFGIPFEVAWRRNMERFLTKKRLNLNKREAKVSSKISLEELKQGDLPAILIGRASVLSWEFVSHDTFMLNAELALVLAVNRGNKDVDADNNMAYLVNSMFFALAQSNGLAMEAYGVYSTSFSLIKGDEYGSSYGYARDYTISAKGYQTVSS